MTEVDEVLKARLNSETARISWTELERHFARGVVIKIEQGADLIDVAMQFSLDNQSTVSDLLKGGTVSKATDEDAKGWLKNKAHFWAVVVAPWVLIQELDEVSE